MRKGDYSLWRSLRRALPLTAACALPLLMCATAQAAEGGHESADFYSGDLGQLIATVIVFVLLLVVLGKWAWKPIVKQLQQREEGIAATLAKAEQREKEAQSLLEQYRSRLDASQKEVEELLNKSRKEAAASREQVLAQARTEAQKVGDVAREDIERAKQSAMGELYDSTLVLATDLAGKIIHKSLSAQDHKQLMNESLEEIKRKAAGK
jgi:F-type H+-transporting ATPase subunit b